MIVMERLEFKLQSPQITTSGSGQYVYAMWAREDNYGKTRIQVAISSNNGVTFSNPTITPGVNIPPNLSDSGESAYLPNVATDDTGKYVYAIWYRQEGAVIGRVQVAISSNNGVTFSNPTIFLK
jgi:hypothetical protein